MPRDGLGQYSPPPGTNGITNYTIESTKYNGFVSDITADLNAARPIVAGGTGGTTVDGALDNLSAEKYKQVVTNWDTNVWLAGSFYAATSATGTAPVPGHAFAGIVYYANATDFVLEATNLTDPGSVKYIRTQTAGVWGAWNTVETTRKNYIVNGAMMISQENGGVAGSVVGYYPVDMFAYAGSPGAEVVSIVQATVGTAAGSPNRFRVSVTTGDSSTPAGKAVMINTAIEGYRSADLYVNNVQKTATLQFGVKAPAGTYCVAFRGANNTRSYVAEYIITAAESNTDTIKSVTLKMDTAAAGAGWNYDNNVGISITWSLACGTTYRTTAGLWTNGNFLASPSQSNFFNISGNVFELFDVSLTEGTTAPPFVVPDYVHALELCQRYWRKNTTSPATWIIATAMRSVTTLSPPMRATPSAALLTVTNNCEWFGMAVLNMTALAALSNFSSASGVHFNITTTAAAANATGCIAGDSISLNARL